MLKKTTIGCRLCRWYIQLQKPLHSHLTESITCQKPLHSKTSTLFDKGVFEIVSKNAMYGNLKIMGIICQSVSKVLFIVKCLDHIIFTTIKTQIISWIINI